ncbi:MAG: AAA family ATPase [Bacillota bacterium]
MRLKRVILENFQSHRQAEIVLAPTVTVLIGESDQGKSAVVRALRWLFYNKPQGADFLRVGADRCRVAMEFEDGVTIVRQRRGKTNRYEILQPGREPYAEEGFGREVPAAVQELTEVRPLKLEGASFELHVAHQLDPPFLLKETPAVRARAVGHLSGTHLFDAADKRAARKLAELTRQRRELEDGVAHLQARMEEFNDLPRLEAQYEECAAFFQRGRDAEARINMLSELKTGRESSLRELRVSENLLETLPRTEELQTRSEQASTLVTLFNELCGLRESKKSSSASLDRVKRVLAATVKVEAAERITAEAKTAVARVKELREMLSRRAETIRRLQRVEAAEAELKDVGLSDQRWHEVKDNTERLRRLKELRQQLLSIRGELAAVEKRLVEARTEAGRQAGKLKELLLKANRCPVCLTPLSPEQVEEILKKELGEES